MLESRREAGVGTALLGVVRHGTLRRGQHFVCGSTTGCIRSLSLVTVGDLSRPKVIEVAFVAPPQTRPRPRHLQWLQRGHLKHEGC